MWNRQRDRKRISGTLSTWPACSAWIWSFPHTSHLPTSVTSGNCAVTGSSLPICGLLRRTVSRTPWRSQRCGWTVCSQTRLENRRPPSWTTSSSQNQTRLATIRSWAWYAGAAMWRHRTKTSWTASTAMNLSACSGTSFRSSACTFPRSKNASTWSTGNWNTTARNTPASSGTSLQWSGSRRHPPYTSLVRSARTCPSGVMLPPLHAGQDFHPQTMRAQGRRNPPG